MTTALIVSPAPDLTPATLLQSKAQAKPKTAPDPTVKAAQQKLADLNLYTGPLDGIMGPLTRGDRGFPESERYKATFW